MTRIWNPSVAPRKPIWQLPRRFVLDELRDYRLRPVECVLGFRDCLGKSRRDGCGMTNSKGMPNYFVANGSYLSLAVTNRAYPYERRIAFSCGSRVVAKMLASHSDRGAMTVKRTMPATRR